MSLIFLSPLTRWYGTPATVGDGFGIRQLSKGEKHELRNWSHALSGRDIEELSACPSWLYKDVPTSDSLLPADEPRSIEIMWDTLRVLQMIAHVSDSALVLVGVQEGGVLQIRSSYRRLPYLPIGWRRHTGFEKARIADIPMLVSAIQSAVNRSIVRLVNPIRLFELGLQSSPIQISTLLWTAGLDALTMANGKKEFADRLAKLLGVNEKVFPPDDYGDNQPEYTVSEVAEDLYELRSEIAHGRRVGRKFLARTTFRLGGPLANIDIWRDRPYQEILSDCACFLLRKALLRILMDSNLLADIQADKTWRPHVV